MIYALTVDDRKKFIPTIWELSLIKTLAPFYFYVGSEDHDLLCLKYKDRIYSTTFNNASDTYNKIRNLEKEILELESGEETILVDVSGEKPKTIFNYGSKEILGTVGYEPLTSPISTTFLAFDKNKNPIKLGTGRCNYAWILSESLLYCNSSPLAIQPNAVGMFVDLLRSEGKFDRFNTKLDALEIISPESRLDLRPGQTVDFVKMAEKRYRRKVKKYIPAVVPDKKQEEKKEKILFSKILNTVPLVEEETEVELDIDLKHYGITEVKIKPGGIIFLTIKQSPEKVFNRSDVVDLIGHEDFSYVLIGA